MTFNREKERIVAVIAQAAKNLKVLKLAPEHIKGIIQTFNASRSLGA